MLRPLLLTLTLFIFTFSLKVNAQIDDPKILDQLDQQGLTPKEAKEKLLNEGYTESQIRTELEVRGMLPPEPVETPEERILKEQRKIRNDNNSNNNVPETKPSEAAPYIEVETVPVEKSNERLVYGKEMFRNKTLSLFEPVGNFKAPFDYIVGAGDAFTVSIWGESEYGGSYDVNSDGYIKPMQMPRIYLKGLTYAQAKEAIISSFGKVVDLRSGTSNIEVLLSYSRPITIGIYGEVENPGTYTLPALNSSVNALVAAGGPNDVGSVRNIKVMRKGEPDKPVDIYKFLLDPSNDDNIYLQNNDIIFVPALEKTVEIKGGIYRPELYELKDNEGLTDLIKFAGGLRPEAYKSNIQINRYEKDENKIVDVKLTELLRTNRDFILNDGDKVEVFKIKSKIENYVEVNGAVEVPGKFELRNGMRVLDIVNKAKLETDAVLDQVYVLRKENDLTKKYVRVNLDAASKNPNSPDNLILRPEDIIRVESKSSFITDFKVSIKGEVRQGGSFEYDSDLRVSDLLYFAGGLKREAADVAIIKRVLPDNTIFFQRVNIREISLDKSIEENLLLAPKDEIEVFPKERFIDVTTVKIFGAVRNPGEIPFNSGITIKDVLYLSGGLKKEAANNRIEVSRLIPNEEESSSVVIATLTINDSLDLETKGEFLLEPLDQIFVRTLPNYEVQRNVEISGEVLFPGLYPILSNSENILSLVERAGGLSPNAFPEGAKLLRVEDGLGYVLLNLKEVLDNPSSRFNYVLKEGDVISIPKLKDLISIKGAIKHPDISAVKQINVPFHKGKRADFYIKKYGAGIDRKEKRGRQRLVFVEGPNGKVEKTRRRLLVKVFPKVKKGSIISVESKPMKEKKGPNGDAKEKPNWGEVFAAVLAQTTAVVTLIVLVDRAFTKE